MATLQTRRQGKEVTLAPPQDDMPKTILIAEDETVLRESLAELLADEGYDVIQAANGKAAYDLVLEQPVDLVLIRRPHAGDGRADAARPAAARSPRRRR